MFSDFVKSQFVEWFDWIGSFDELVGCFSMFGNEDIQVVQDINDLLWQCVYCVFFKWGGDEIEFFFVWYGNVKVVIFVEI